MSIIKKTFGRYFPSLLALSDKASKAKFKFKIGNKDYDAEIDDRIFIKIEGLPEKFKKRRLDPDSPIAFDEFMILFDGVPQEDSHDLLIKDKENYTLKMVQEWAKELFTEKAKDILKKIKAEKGLTDETIKEYKIGYNSTTEEIVVPFLNYTEEGVSAINFYSSKDLQFTRNYGSDRLFGFHEIIKSKYKIGNLFLAVDEFEAILLRQLGYNAISPFICGGWRPEFEAYLGQFFIYIYNDVFIEQVNWRFESINRTCNGAFQIKQGDNLVAEMITKQGYDKTKIDQLISNKKSMGTFSLRNYAGLRDFEAKKDIKHIEFSQCLVEGTQYYGAVTGEKFHFISGQRLNVDVYDFLLHHPTVAFEEKDEYQSKISLEGYKKFLIEDYSPKENKAFSVVKEYLKDFIYLPDDKFYDFMSLWIIGTYIYLNFEYYPYIHIQAPKASGKSTLLDVVSRLCFNASYDLGPTPAVILRQINTFQSTILLDEVESFKSNSGQKDILQILNQGYSQKGHVPRVRGDSVISYKVYSPKIFAGINEINDVLLSRSIKVQIEEKPKSVSLKRFRVDSKLEKKIQSIVDELYIFGLMYAKEIDDVDKILLDLPETKDLENRELDTWGPIFSIAKVVDKDGKLGLINDLQDYVELDRKLKTENFKQDESKLHNFLKEYLTEENMLKKNSKKEMIFSRDDLFDTAKSESVLPKAIDSINKFTTYLKDKYEIESKNVDVKGDKNKKYVVTQEILDKCFPKKTESKKSKSSASSKTVTKTTKVVTPSKASLYIPENVIITKRAETFKETNEILNRIKKLNPKVNVEHVNNEKPSTIGLSSEEVYHKMKKTLVLGTRSSSSFIETFPSPGHIVEKPNTMIIPVWNCCFECEYCYLQKSTRNNPHQKIYVDYKRIENEIQNEMIFDTIVRSLLTSIHKLEGTNFYKIPKNFRKVVQKTRKSFLGLKGDNSITEKDARDYLKANFVLMLDEFKELKNNNNNDNRYDRNKIKSILRRIDKIYDENKKIRPTFVISEYCDLLGIDHISNQFEFFMELLQKLNEFKFSFRTRSANIKNLLKFDGLNKVLATIQFDPEHVLKNYQKGTSTLNERIAAVKQIQNAKGFRLKIAIEPLMMYKNYEKDYKNLIQILANSIDMTKVENFDIGGFRANKLLQTLITKNYPNSEILRLPIALKESPQETNYRYPIEERVKIYKLLKTEIEKHSKASISLGAETPEAWEQTGITIKKASDYFYKLK